MGEALNGNQITVYKGNEKQGKVVARSTSIWDMWDICGLNLPGKH